METIICPVDKELLLQELTPERKLENTNKGGNELYVFDAHQAPNLMREVARLREEAFRAEGGCTGKSMDIDIYDTMEKPYKQLIVWDPDRLEIIGGYRFIIGSDVSFDADGRPILATAELFEYSEEFIRKYLPHTLELGRSFVSLGYQSSKAGAKALFSLDNLWDGITAIIMQHPHLIYTFGKVTIHPSFDKRASSMLMEFMAEYYKDDEGLVRPIKQLSPVEGAGIEFCGDYQKDYAALKNAIQELGYNIPPLVNSYMSLSPTMKYFGFAECHDLVGAIEGGIMINFNEIVKEKLDRHIKAFLTHMIKKLVARFPHLHGTDLESRLPLHWKQKRSRAAEFFKNSKK